MIHELLRIVAVLTLAAAVPTIRSAPLRRTITYNCAAGVILKVTYGPQWADLMASEPTDSGRMIGKSEYYFENGTVRFVRHPFARYVLHDGRLLLWLDEHLNPLRGIPARDWRARERSLLREVQGYLRLFGLR